MSLEAWGDENQMDRGPWRDCPDCDSSGELQQLDSNELLVLTECKRCFGAGQIYYEYEHLPDDVI